MCRILSDYGICDVEGPASFVGVPGGKTDPDPSWFVQLGSQFEALQLCESAANGKRTFELRGYRFKLRIFPMGDRIRAEFDRYADLNLLKNRVNEMRE